MKTILVFVTTLDGKITKWDKSDVKSWSSKQDQIYFQNIWNESLLIVMGSKTFDVNPPVPSSKRRVVVLTRRTAEYKTFQVPGQLEFSSDSPLQVVQRFRNKGLKQMTIVGGSRIASSFLKEKLIDEVWLTIEPRIFGIGDNFVKDEKLNIILKLLHHEKVNEHGTLITKYKVLREMD